MSETSRRDAKYNFADLAESFYANRLSTMKKRIFSKTINKAMVRMEKGGDEAEVGFRSKEEKVAALDDIMNWDAFPNMDSAEVMMLFSAYRALGEYDKMIEVFNKTNSADFKEAPMVREAVAFALRKRSPHEKDDLQNSMEMSFELARQGKASCLSYDNIGKCIGKKAGTKASPEMLKIFEEGFEKTLNPELGLRAVRVNMYLGDNKKAQETAKVAYLASLRDGAEENKNFYTVSTALQCACIAGEDKDVLDHLCGRLAVSLSYSFQLEEFERSIAKIEKAGINPAGVRQIQQQISGWKEKIKTEALEGGVIVWNENIEDSRTFGNDPKLDALVSRSYNYRGCGTDFCGTSRVSGNMAFGGRLPDHTISKKDLDLFTGLIEKTPAELGIDCEGIAGAMPERKLSEIKDPELFMRLTDKFVRQTFTTDNFAGTGLHMEDNALAKNKNGESVYDATVKAVIRSCGKMMQKDSDIDTRTNISAIFALGMGDCRHHAQVKQILFDMYQRKQMNDQIGKMYARVQDGEQIDLHGEDAKKFYDVLDTEVRTADVQVKTPVLMKQTPELEWRKATDYNFTHWKQFVKTDENDKTVMKDMPYNPELDENGRYKVDQTGKLHNLEDHTLCWMLKKDRNGNLKSFGLRDAFYQDRHYHWGNMDVDVDKIQIDKLGNPLIPAGFISADKTDKGEEVPVFQEPTRYNTGRRDTVETRSIGTETCLVGVHLAGFDDTEAFLNQIKARSEMGKIMNEILRKDPWKKTPNMDYTPVTAVKSNSDFGQLDLNKADNSKTVWNFTKGGGMVDKVLKDVPCKDLSDESPVKPSSNSKYGKIDLTKAFGYKKSRGR